MGADLLQNSSETPEDAASVGAVPFLTSVAFAAAAVAAAAAAAASVAADVAQAAAEVAVFWAAPPL
eukprot:CAMPEP_0172938252 /NCGR_PEP_ID=MMETSP1075-20121228/222932_1 /TAXON_ID=2916 /ORGANISM="Ceratium fusus, Strain PA161109" /LENGTH=65 /DNA_ID=CAMNT_0013799631 /DNA_START=1122 /DNA_END=1320 /DNA_ORIENTATION=-